MLRCSPGCVPNFAATLLTGAEDGLRREVREFLAVELPRGSYRPSLGMTGGRDPDFSKRLAERGWVGMALPTQFGGGNRSAVDRFLVGENCSESARPLNIIGSLIGKSVH
jgi:alkylation response protein AidB-like acyl-CoA dehydrogenase